MARPSCLYDFAKAVKIHCRSPFREGNKGIVVQILQLHDGYGDGLTFDVEKFNFDCLG